MVNFNRGPARNWRQRAVIFTRAATLTAAKPCLQALWKVVRPRSDPAKGATADPRQNGHGLAMSTPRRSPLSSKPAMHGTRSAVRHRQWDEPAPRRRDCDFHRPRLLRSQPVSILSASVLRLRQLRPTPNGAPRTPRLAHLGRGGMMAGSKHICGACIVACDEQRRIPDTPRLPVVRCVMKTP
jgi:hypothetical protein